MSGWNVLFVGLGGLGRIIVADYLARGLGRVAGAVDSSSSLAGRALDTAVSHEKAHGTTILASVEEAFRVVEPRAITSAVVATSSDFARCLPTLRTLVSAGVSVVSTCEEMIWPWLRHGSAARELDELCRRCGVRCVGTGVNLGFLMDALPVMLTAVCRSVRRVRVERFQDASARREAFQRKIGAGMTDAEFAAGVKAGSLRHVGLGESLHFIAHYLGLDVARWEETIEPERATEDQRCAAGEVRRGGIAGVRQTATAWDARGEEVVALDFRAAIGLERPRDRIVIAGDPPLEVVIPGGVHGDSATSAIVLNAIPRLLESPPGLHTMATLCAVRHTSASDSAIGLTSR